MSTMLQEPNLPAAESTSISVFVGLGCEASSSSFADNLSALSFSTGPKTLDFNFDLFDFLTLDLSPFAMVSGIQYCMEFCVVSKSKFLKKDG